ncbi:MULTISPECIES: M15 family metallopeptidase [unclassified Tolypothrix]|uniref:M15 family metallopeptidase n=1 Tax=unclassified Tolypothrix TaxID=2649714 RepID=UPI0005EAA6C8|nr:MULTISPECIES: M15 family metallopeptidase [unclassified Tolypothrix]EKE98524.1 serine-type D-Ala-D-Ala protein [Tolypothrix sp. PCC 7601]BAY92248.1 D-alanyl-D-alanine carboxypeptidase [Microchaete diplosiphon NIES-3275]
MRFFSKLPYLARILIIATIVAFSIVICGTLMMRFSASNPAVQATTAPPTPSVVTTQPTSQPTSDLPAIPTAALPTNSTPLKVARTSSVNQKVNSNQLAYGHFPYTQANSNQMTLVGSYASGADQRFESLNIEAVQAFMKMTYAAREVGVWIIPVSGFRTIEQQQKLFLQQIKRRGSEKEAAKISAPPGYSEHHTGFALDLTDGKFPKQDITLAFENTDAYRWLTSHAKEFGFELSFPRNNSQGVSFEPWHWRYVGSAPATAVFANARNQR